MKVTLRPGRPEDAEACGRIYFEAFRTIAVRHGFPPDLPTVAVATKAIANLLSLPGSHAIVAEVGGRVVASTFVHDRRPVAAVGPVTVDPGSQDRGIGRRMMEEALAWIRERDFPSVRLVQSAYHTRSLALYARLGFEAREPLSVLQGPAIAGTPLPGRSVRPATGGDVGPCEAVCERVHGFARSFELARAVERATALVVEREGRIAGYAAEVGFRHHSVAETNEDLMALIASATAYSGPGFLLPTRNAEVLRWCLDHGLKVVQPMTLMTMGWYREPRGAYLPSISF